MSKIWAFRVLGLRAREFLRGPRQGRPIIPMCHGPIGFGHYLWVSTHNDSVIPTWDLGCIFQVVLAFETMKLLHKGT